MKEILNIYSFHLNGKIPSSQYIRQIAPLKMLAEQNLINLIDANVLIKRVGQNLVFDSQNVKRNSAFFLQRDFRKFSFLFKFNFKIYYDIDDILWDIPKNHPDYNRYSELGKLLENRINDFEKVSCSTTQLKKELIALTHKIEILPNTIVYQPKLKKYENKKVRILISGTKSHLKDIKLILPAIKKIAVKYKEKVEFIFWGIPIDEFLYLDNIIFINEFIKDYREYLDFLASLQIDIGLIPLIEDRFNSCKSDIKWKEYSICKIASITSNVVGFKNVSNNKDGILVNNNSQEWYKAIEILLINQNFRKLLAENSYQRMKRDFLLKNHLEKWKLYLGISESKNEPLISIIIPVWNKVELTKQCLEAIQINTEYSNYEVIIIDNASTDETSDFLKVLGGDVKIITNDKNLGFAKASNQGAKIANGEYLVFLNNDTIPQKGWLTNLVNTISSSKNIGIVGAKLFYPDNTIQHCGASMRYDKNFFRHQYKFLHKSHPLVNFKRNLDAVTAACFITSNKLFVSLGYFDENYLNGCEDMDYCTAVREKGMEIIYEPKSELYHLESQTPRMSNKDKDNFDYYIRKWGGNRMKNEMEIYAEDGFWLKNGNVFEQQNNQLLQNWLIKFENAKNNGNVKLLEKYSKIIGRIYPVKSWTKINEIAKKDQLNNHQNKKLRILFVVHDFPPYRFAGAQLYARNLAKKINQLGFAKVDILHPVFREIDESKKYTISKTRKYDLDIYEFYKEKISEPQKIYDESVENICSEFYKKNNYDVIHFHGLGQITLAPVFAAKKLNIPTIMTFHDYWFLCDRWHLIRGNQSICKGPENIQKCAECFIDENNLEKNRDNYLNVTNYKKYRKEMMLKSFSLIDIKIAPSKYLANVFEKWGFAGIEVDPLGFEYKNIAEEIIDYRKSKKLIFGFSGQIIVRKGINFLIEAFKSIQNANIELHIWGKLNLKNKFVQDIIQKIESDDRIIIKGEYQPEDLEKIYKTFDVAVIPSLMENYPLVVQEAFINKTPVIATKVGGIPEVVIDNINGLLVKAGDAEEISKAMQKIINNPTLINKFITNIPSVKKLSEDAEIYFDYYSSLNKKSNKIRKYSVQFYVLKNVHWAMFEELYNYFKRNEDIEKIYICLPQINQIIVNNNYSIIDKIMSLDVEVVAKPKKNVDVTFIADTIAGKVSGCGKIINIGHGTISKGYYFTDSVWTERENWVDLLCVPGDYAKKQFEKILETKVVATGMPKLDPIFKGEYNREKLCQKLHLDNDKKIILYAPTFNKDLSSVFDFSENFSELHNDNYYILIKLHGSTLPYLVEIYKNFAKKYKNFIFIDDPNIASYIAGADIMISDVSSAFMEFMALDKPVILYNNKNQKKYHGYNPENIEYRWRDLGYQVSSIQEVKRKLFEIFNNDGKSLLRKKYAEKLFADLKGNACRNVWNATKNILTEPLVKRMDSLSIGLILNTDNLFSIRQIIREIQFYSVIAIDLIIIVKGTNQRIEEFLQYLTNFNQFRNLKIIRHNSNFKESIINLLNQAESDFFLYLNEDVNVYKNFGYIILKTFKNNPKLNAITGVTDKDGCQNGELFVKNMKENSSDQRAYLFINKFQGKEVFPFDDNNLPKLWCLKLEGNKFENFTKLKEFLLKEIVISPSIYYSSVNDDDFATLKKVVRYRLQLPENEYVKVLSEIFKNYSYSDFAEDMLEILSKQNKLSYDDKIYLARISLIGRFYDYFYKRRLMKILNNNLIVSDLSKELEIFSKLKSDFSKKENKGNRDVKVSMNHKKILFYFFKNVHIPILIPIYEKLKKMHPEIKIAFSYLKPAPQIRAGLNETELNLISKFNVDIYDYPQQFNPDLTFIADSVYPWVKNCGKLVHVGHGILSKGQYYTDTEIAKREQQADLVCVPGKYHQEIMEKIISKPVIATGMAKLDKLFSGELTKEKVLEKYGLPEDYRYILYAPTFNDELSSIPFIGEKIYEIIPDKKTFLIIKLHGSTNSKYKKMFSEMPISYPNVIYVDDEEIDITPFLIIADIMISDVSSAMIEFAALDKPLILFNNPNWSKYKNFNPDDIEYRIRDMAIETDSITEIKRAIKIYSIDNKIKSDLRKQYTDLLLENKNSGNATEIIIEESLKLIGVKPKLDLNKTSKFWGDVDKKVRKNFWDIQFVKKYRNELISGDPELGFLNWFGRKFISKPFQNGLSLGCGSGELERFAIDRNFVEKILGVDISSERIKIANSKIGNRNITYLKADLNQINLPKNTYDFVIAKMILHHISDLEHLFSQLSNSLTGDGLIYVSEYIGPNRFQFSDKVINVMNDLLKSIPEKFRKLSYNQKLIKHKIGKIPIRQILEGDPTEAIRSEEIDLLIPKYFNVVESHQSGGTILFWLLDGIAHNFDNSEASNRILSRLIKAEKELVENEIIPEYFKIYVLKQLI
jgi:GT2 family glycosyltransferase/CDP-glycerol glycerophosphotransferase (TagB/SpsB family)/glycosyltransferase involved in cell wall biosynthesis/ubiquinone/menaquinone biosynthesis C-methylase UbiE